MFYRRKFKRDMKDIKTPEIGKVLPGFGEDTGNGITSLKKVKRHALIVPMAIILSCLIFIGTVACAVPVIINYLNADMLTENNTQLKKVPEGWMGIYTVKDLNNVRNDLYKNYILMRDITFTDEDYAPGGICEGGWEPIDGIYYEEVENNARRYTVKREYAGTFNGNGHIIRNLKINTGDNLNNIGLFGITGASFINLGIEGCEITVTRAINDESHLNIGAIAGTADFIGGCYASDVSINVNLDTSTYIEEITRYNKNATETQRYQKVYVGGLGGNVGYVDSCYTDAQIVVDEKGDAAVDLRVGGLAGASTSCVTSYYTGSISAEQSKFYNCQTNTITVSDVGSNLPVMISEDAMDSIFEICKKYYGEETFSFKKIKAYFLLKKPNVCMTAEALSQLDEYLKQEIDKYYFTEDVSDVTGWYLFDPTASIEENIGIAQLIAEAFGGYDVFQQFCLENKIKCGILYCYSFEPDKKFKESDLYAFNFDTIWVIKKGQALLKIFES